MKRFWKGIIAGIGVALLVEAALVVLAILFGMSFSQAVLAGLLTIAIIASFAAVLVGAALLIEWAND